MLRTFQMPLVYDKVIYYSFCFLQSHNYLDFSGSFSFFYMGILSFILDAILDFPDNNKVPSFFASCINFMVSEECC